MQDRGVGFVFQSYALFKHMTLAENIAFGPRTRKLDMDVDARWGSDARSFVMLQPNCIISAIYATSELWGQTQIWCSCIWETQGPHCLGCQGRPGMAQAPRYGLG